MTEYELMVDSLQMHFGPSWKWSEIASWTLARTNADPPLPRPQITWARIFEENRKRAEGEWKD